jgi:hypothetical protein
MKAFVFALFISMMTGTAWAGATIPKTQAECEKAGGEWDAATDKCTGG